MKVSTNWLRDFVTLSPPLENIADRLTMAGLEVKKQEALPNQKDFLWEVEITTNRPDWLSHFGVAREIAAVENISLKPPAIETVVNRPMPSGWKVEIKEAEGCPYYTGVYIEGIAPAPTPDFMRERLLACGIRSISLIVDITNYVLLETGQPLHAFDADSLQGQEIRVRRARAGEKMTAIDGAVLTLDANDLLITDRERPVAMAGIMGGKDSEVNERTRNLFLESAFFHPRWVRQASRRHSLASESSYRFERRVDPEGVDFARERAIALIKQYAKPRFISGVLKAGQKPRPVKEKIMLTAAEVEKRLGFALKPHEIVSALTRLGLENKQEGAGSWNVVVPSFRYDLLGSIDLIEEVARIYGYDKIPSTLPAREPVLGRVDPFLKLQDKAREFFPGAGFYETVTFSLISGAGLETETDLGDAVWINNPQNAELCWMRPTFLPSLLGVAQKNFHQGIAGVSLFEIAHTYHKRTGAHPEERRVLGFLLSGKIRPKSWADADHAASFYDLKGAGQAFLELLGIEDISYTLAQKSYLKESNSEKISARGEEIGFVGEVNPKLLHQWGLEHAVFYGELFLDKLVSCVRWKRPLQELAKYPAIERDIAITVTNDTKAGVVEEEIRRAGGALVRKVELFDLFSGGRIPKGHKNLGFRVTYQSLEKTLLSEDIQKLHTEIADKIAKKFHASFQ